MSAIDRRSFLGASLGAAALTQFPTLAFAAPQCVTAPLPPFLPTRLSVDCASKQNFKLFRQETANMGLTGVVSMTTVRGQYGTYPAGNLFLFPWLKPTGLALGASRSWNCVVPTSATLSTAASPVPGTALPPDEFYCRLILQSPWTSFIGVMIDDPYSKADAKLGWLSNIDRLTDRKGVGIDWTSANLNGPWFGGSNYIGATDTCSGKAWRALIADGLMQASASVC